MTEQCLTEATEGPASLLTDEQQQQEQTEIL